MPDKSNGDIAADGYNKYKVKNSGCYLAAGFFYYAYELTFCLISKYFY